MARFIRFRIRRRLFLFPALFDPFTACHTRCGRQHTKAMSQPIDEIKVYTLLFPTYHFFIRDLFCNFDARVSSSRLFLLHSSLRGNYTVLAAYPNTIASLTDNLVPTLSTSFGYVQGRQYGWYEQVYLYIFQDLSKRIVFLR